MEVAWDGNATLGVAFQDAATAASAFSWVVGQIGSYAPWLVVEVMREDGMVSIDGHFWLLRLLPLDSEHGNFLNSCSAYLVSHTSRILCPAAALWIC